MAKEPGGGWRASEIRLLATVMLINLIDGLDYQLLPLSIGTISTEWQVDPASFSAAVSAGFAGAALGTPIGGWMGDRWGRKAAILTGMVLFGLMTVAQAWCVSPSQLIGARLAGGIGLGACLPPMLALVIESVGARRRGTAVALTMLSVPLGLTLAGVIVPRLNLLLGWTTSFVVCACLIFAIAALAFFSLTESRRDGPAVVSDAPLVPWSRKAATLIAQIDIASILAMMGGIFLVYCAMSAALSWLPAFAYKQGFSQVVGGQAISFWSFSGIVGSLLAGWAVNRVGGARASRFVVAGFSAAALISGLVLAAAGLVPAVLYISAAFTGVFANAAMTVIYAAAGESLPAKVRSNGIGVVTLAGKLGGIVGGASGVVMLALPSLGIFFGVLAAISGVAALCLLKAGAAQSAREDATARMPELQTTDS